MTNTDLRVRLRDLNEQLSSINIDPERGSHVDEETFDDLYRLVTDVGQLVDKANRTNDRIEVADNHQDLHDRIVQLSSEHPHVSQFLTQTTDLLAMMGI